MAHGVAEPPMPPYASTRMRHSSGTPNVVRNVIATPMKNEITRGGRTATGYDPDSREGGGRSHRAESRAIALCTARSSDPSSSPEIASRPNHWALGEDAVRGREEKAHAGHVGGLPAESRNRVHVEVEDRVSSGRIEALDPGLLADLAQRGLEDGRVLRIHVAAAGFPAAELPVRHEDDRVSRRARHDRARRRPPDPRAERVRPVEEGQKKLQDLLLLGFSRR